VEFRGLEVSAVQLQNPVGVVAPTLDAPVIAVLARAEQSFTGRQVHRLAGHGTEQGVRNALERLVEQGVVRRSQAGASYLYELNRQHLAAPHLIGLATLRDDLFARWRELIGQWPVQPRVVVLFGSAARGDMRPNSDIDLLVVTDDEHEALEESLARLQTSTAEWTGNDTRALHVTASQVGPDEPAIVAAAEEGITVSGDAAWLRRAVRKQVGHGA
jgi:predicted nucleotidyltransferase